MTLRRALTALTAVLVFGLAGCGGLPETGPVVDGLRLDAPIPPLIGRQLEGPAPGATPEQIALGFVRAAEEADEGRPTARQFLMPTSDARWRWSDQDIVVVDSVDNLTIRKLAADTLEVRASAIAKVSPEGRYTDLPLGSQVATTFGLRKDRAGQWRIDLPAQGFGLWLDSDGFSSLYSAYNVYYVTRTGRQLVPDRRWFPTGSRTATALARAQLDPPPPYLKGALATGIPPGTTLAVNAVPVENGRAQVTLSEEALEADPDERAAMWAQLAATLSAIPSVRTVSITAGETELELPDLGTAVSEEDLNYDRVSPRYFETALLRRKGGFMARVKPRSLPDTDSNRRGVNKLKDGDPVQIPDSWIRLAMSVDEAEVAAVGEDLAELSRWRGAKWVKVRRFGTQLTRPTYDGEGFLWIGGVAGDGSGRIFAQFADARLTDAAPEPVSAPWLKGRRVIALAAAVDSARMLVVTSDLRGTDVRLGVSGIVRSPSGIPTSVTAPLRLAEPLTSITDVAWLEEGDYAVLGRIARSEPLRAWRGEIGAGLEGIRDLSAKERRSQILPQGFPVSLTSIGSYRALILISNLGAVWVRAGATWQRMESGTDLLVPGR